MLSYKRQRIKVSPRTGVLQCPRLANSSYFHLLFDPCRMKGRDVKVCFTGVGHQDESAISVAKWAGNLIFLINVTFQHRDPLFYLTRLTQHKKVSRDAHRGDQYCVICIFLFLFSSKWKTSLCIYQYDVYT